jgi:hypothetical protein
VVEHAAAGRPAIRQIFTLYPSHPDYFLLHEQVANNNGSILSSNYLGALIVDASTGYVAAPPGSDPRLLDLPFDNDEWVRFDSRKLGTADFTGTSYEATAIYESQSRAGLVIGSITHDFWKTGVYYGYTAASHKITSLNVWGGAATPDAAKLPSGATYGGDGTHDVAPHGAMTAAQLQSPRVLVGCFADWRDGMEQYGQANAIVAPPRTWASNAPFGWMSWGAYGEGVTGSRLVAVSDFVAQQLTPGGFTSPGGVFVDIDAGFKGDSTCATEACVAQHVHANGQKAGTYRTPFSYFGTDLTAAVPNTSYTYTDVVLRDGSGNPIRRHDAYMIDVTHPGGKQLIHDAMASVVSNGFDLVKLDFLTDGAMEGAHYDATVATGIQAFNQAMAYVDSLLPANVFVSESIAPIFPSQYAHSRRISTDVVGQLDDTECPTWPHYGSTEYMLNSLSFGWWMQGNLYAFDDPDGMALMAFEPSSTATYPELWAQTRVTASAIAGTMFFDTTDPASGSARELAYLTNTGVNAIAAAGRALRPLDGVGYVSAPTCDGARDTSSGAAASTVFVRDDGATVTVAAFDYDGTQPATVAIDLTRLGLSATSAYTATDVWTHTTTTATKTLELTLSPGQSTIVQLSAN